MAHPNNRFFCVLQCIIRISVCHSATEILAVIIVDAGNFSIWFCVSYPTICTLHDGIRESVVCKNATSAQPSYLSYKRLLILPPRYMVNPNYVSTSDSIGFEPIHHKLPSHRPSYPA